MLMMNSVFSETDNLAFIHNLCETYAEDNALSLDPRQNPNVKRGLRNEDGTGVMAGYTQIGSVRGYSIMDGERVPMEGHLIYRGYDIMDLIHGYAEEKRFGFEEVVYLLLFGKLPNQAQYDKFCEILLGCMNLPPNFTEDMILKQPSRNIMNKLARAVLALYSTDEDPDNVALENIIRQCIELVARFPMIVAHAYAVKRHYFDYDSLYLHRPKPGLSLAENFLHAIRNDQRFTEQEARLLDLCLVIHAEHGGGNNSTFACRVLSSTGTDTYSAISAAVGSLKGPNTAAPTARSWRSLKRSKKMSITGTMTMRWPLSCAGFSKKRSATIPVSSMVWATPSTHSQIPVPWCSSRMPGRWRKRPAIWRNFSFWRLSSV